jgi:hypothetical protein
VYGETVFANESNRVPVVVQYTRDICIGILGVFDRVFKLALFTINNLEKEKKAVHPV